MEGAPEKLTGVQPVQGGLCKTFKQAVLAAFVHAERNFSGICRKFAVN